MRQVSMARVHPAPPFPPATVRLVGSGDRSIVGVNRDNQYHLLSACLHATRSPQHKIVGSRHYYHDHVRDNSIKSLVQDHTTSQSLKFRLP